jgi:methylenetetrahydrofolate reductase (NADPH)
MVGDSFMKLPNLSFEFFPPKTPEGMKNLCDTANTLAELEPDFFSITFGAGGSTLTGTVNTLKMLTEKTKISIAPHISCVGATAEEVVGLLEEYKSLGVKRIVALRGDMPSGMGQMGEMKYASELVALIRKTTQDYFHIEVAAYPEFHPHALSAHDDILNLKRKIEAGANSAITQYFYNPDSYFYFIDECARNGIFVPIVPGIMPITQFARLVRFSDICGAEIPRWIRKRLEDCSEDAEAVKKLGFEVVYDLCQRLLSGGAPGLHFYTLNQAEASYELVKMLNPNLHHSALKDSSPTDEV